MTLPMTASDEAAERLRAIAEARPLPAAHIISRIYEDDETVSIREDIALLLSERQRFTKALEPFAEYSRINPHGPEAADEAVPDGVFTMGQCDEARDAMGAPTMRPGAYAKADVIATEALSPTPGPRP